MRNKIFASVILAIALLLGPGARAQNSGNSFQTQTIPGGLRVLVTGGSVMVNGLVVSINTQVVQTPNATNYIYISSAGVLSLSSTAFPTGGLPVSVVNCDLNNLVVTSISDARPQWILTGAPAASGTPGGSPGNIQINNSPNFAGSNFLTVDSPTSPTTLTVGGNENISGVLNVAADAVLKGLDPYSDIRQFGATAQVVHTTGTGSGSSITVGSSAIPNGVGIVIQGTTTGGGAAPLMATPAAPTVTTGLVESETAQDAPMSTGLTGASTYNYKIFARDFNGAKTAPSSVTTIANGLPVSAGTCTAPAMGLVNCAISSWTLTGSTLTITTTTANPAVQHAFVHITGTTNNFDAGGWYPISTINSGTTFTINNVPQFAVSASGGAQGNVAFFSGNHLSWAQNTGGSGVTQTWEYFICAQRPGDGSYHIIGTSFPTYVYSPFGPAIALTFDDFGTTLSANPVLPWFVSDADCAASSASNGPLVTTVTSGGGTTTLGLASPITGTVTGTGVRIDNAPAFSSAQSFVTGNSAMYIPAVGAASFEINSSLPMALTKINIIQNGNITINDTFAFPVASNWYSFMSKGQGPTGISFAFNDSATISCHAFPCIYAGSMNTSGQAQGATNFIGLTLVEQVANSLLLLVDANWGMTFKFMNFRTCQSSCSADNMGLGLVIRPGAANFSIEDSNISAGPGQVIDQTWSPAVYLTQDAPANGGTPGNTQLKNTMWNRRGMLQMSNGGSGVLVRMEDAYRQGGITPLYMVQGINGTTTGRVEQNFIFHDTESQPAYTFVCNLSCAGSTLGYRLGFANGVSQDAGTTPMQISGGGGGPIAPIVAGFDLGDNQGSSNSQATLNLGTWNFPLGGAFNGPVSGTAASFTSANISGLAAVGTLSAGNSNALLSSGAANPTAVFYNWQTASSGTTTTSAKNISAGHALVVGIYVGATGASISSITDTLGTSFVQQGTASLSGGGGGTGFWYFGCVPGAGGSDSVSVTPSTNVALLSIWDVTGVNCTTPTDTTKFSLATTTTPSVATITTANANELVLAFVRGGTGITSTPGSGYTLDGSGNPPPGSNGSSQMQHQVFASSSSTTTAPFTLSGSTGAYEGAIALIGQVPQLGTTADPWVATFSNTYNTGSKCAAAGTSAATSLVACGSAAAGLFSVPITTPTAAQVSTTAVGANSVVIVQQRLDTAAGTALSVTCNSTANATFPNVTALSAGASFSISMAAFAVNPGCYEYWIINQ
jgi:hypothetical protein